MTHPEQMLLEAISAFVRGEHVSWTEPVYDNDMNELMRLAEEQKIQPLIYEAVYSCAGAAEWSGLAAGKRKTVTRVTAQMKFTAELLSIYEKMREAGLHVLIVKGIMCRSLYPNGDCRASRDEDMIVPEDEFEAACQILRECGMMPVGKLGCDAWMREGSAFKLELHTGMFESDKEAISDLNAFFEGAHRDSEEYTVEGNRKVRSLSPHDHLLFLLLHAYKHFLFSGFGIRQVCDIGLWASRYADRIDWEKMSGQLKSVRVWTFSKTVFQIARKYLGIAPDMPDNWLDTQTDCEPMLADMLDAGVYGSSSRSRRHSAGVTLNAVRSGKKNGLSGVLSSAFPSKKRLETRYPVLRKFPVLLPGVWAHRLLGYGLETVRRRDSSALTSISIAKERIELLKMYDIID